MPDEWNRESVAASARVRPHGVGYAVALLALALATAARFAVDPLFGDNYPFVTYFMAIALVAWFGRTTTAIFTFVVSTGLCCYFFVSPRYTFAKGNSDAVLGIPLFLAAAGLIVAMSHAMRIARNRAESLLMKSVEQRSELLRSSEAEAEQRERLRTTLASIGDGVIATDLEGRVTDLNTVAESLTGWSSTDAAGLPLTQVFRIVNESTRAPVENPALRALREGVIVGLANHTLLIARDGTERPIDDSAAPIRTREGTVVGSVLVFRDITERKRAEAANRDAQQQIATTLESITDGFVRLDSDWRVVYVNAEGERINQIPRTETLGRTIWELFPSIVGTRLESQYRRCMEERATVEFENYYAPFDRWYALKMYPAQGGGLTVFLRDITERKAEREALEASEARFRAGIEAVSSIIWTNDAEGRMAGEQPGWGGFTGQSFREYQGFGWSQAVHPEDAQTTIDAWNRAVAAKRTFVFQHRVRRSDGQWRTCSIRAVPVLNEDGAIEEWVGVHTDITEAKEAEEELRRLASELSEAARRKDEFIATLAHELRNPLAPIRNGLQFLRLAGVSGTLEETRAMMERQLAQMVRLVDDLLDVSRVTQGKLELRRERVEIRSIVDAAVETARPLIEQAGHELVIALHPEPIFVDGDLTRLAQIVLNLLTNSAKYTHRGGRIRLVVETNDTGIAISVSDDGIGIPPAMLGRVFDMFIQVDRALEKTTGGLGIGLSLVKGLVEMHGGTIEAHSPGEGLGSEFVVRLPVIPAPTTDALSGPGEPVVEGAPAAPMRILVVDDNIDSAESLGQLLEMLGHEIRTAHDGEAGIVAAEAFRPRVVLMDIGMPKLNGYEAAKRIRESPWGQGLALVALTGWGQDNDRKKSADAGFDLHLVKPVDPLALLKLLDGVNAAKA